MIALLPGVGDAIEILTGGEVRGQEWRVLVPCGMFKIVVGSGRAVHGGQVAMRACAVSKKKNVVIDDDDGDALSTERSE